MGITFENGSKRSGVAKVMSSVGGGANEPAMWLADIPCGYHELRIEANDAVTSLIVTPGRRWLPDQFSHGGGHGESHCNSIFCARHATAGLGILLILRDSRYWSPVAVALYWVSTL